MKLPTLIRLRRAQAHTPFRVSHPAAADALRWRIASLSTRLRDTLEAELDERRGFLWLAVAFGTGALIYFGLPAEPWLPAVLAAASVCAALAWRGWQRGRSWRIAAMLAMALSGMAAAGLRVASLDGPAIVKGVTADVTGRVIQRDKREARRPRVVLDTVEISGVAAAATPAQLRITLSPKADLPPLGDRVKLRARLSPVPGPSVPGAYDPRMAAFFEGIRGSGFALGAWTRVAPGNSWQPSLVISRIRQGMVDRINAALPGETGAMAAALLVGDRSGVTEATNESLRLSGLAHILSISGLHMMLIAGVAFVTVRSGLALSPALALHYPIRKWAALAALLVVTGYFALSGGGAATLRSYVMAAIMFAAILADRPAISMRNLALAVFVTLATEPESVIEPGFQMSFAAVAALIAGWEAWRDRPRLDLAERDAVPGLWLLRLAGKSLAGVLITTIVASAATAPFGAYHFERISTYSLLGNLLTSPLTSAIIMPFGLLALFAMPFGLEALPLTVMSWGTTALLAVSDAVAALPGANVHAPNLTGGSLLLITAGLLWLCLWRRRWRLGGFAVMTLGIVLNPLFRTTPDLMVTADGKAVAVRDAGGVLRVSGSRAGSFVTEQMFEKERSGLPTAASMSAGVACDGDACLLSAAGGLRVSHILKPSAFAEDCRWADVIVTPLDAPKSCAAKLVIDRAGLQRTGAEAIMFPPGNAGAAQITADLAASPRPWQRPPVVPADEAAPPRQ